MVKRTLLATGLLLLILIGLALAVARPGPPTQAAPPDGPQLQRDLATIGWEFTPSDAEHPLPTSVHGQIISREQALATVRNRYSQPAHEATALTATLGTLTKPRLQQAQQAGERVATTFTIPRSVWIVTLSGVATQSSGPPGAPRKTSNELNVVVDAQSGTVLMDFVWTR
jgi:hypothetical protein